jgi:hypothetical protein
MVSTVKKIDQQLNKSKARNRIIRVRTKHPDESSFDGIVLQNDKSFVALRTFDDFEANGIVVVPKKWLKNIRDGEFEDGTNEVIRFAGTITSRDMPAWPKMFANLTEILSYLKERDIWPAIEIVYDGGSPLYVGPITEVTKKRVRLYCYDAAGKWEKEYDIDVTEIFKIEIESRYTRHFSAYMKVHRPPPHRERS